ncbi:GGDEF domain-containing protein [Solidesulfovibrio magneticus]|uniref:diguanylate cyclase n=1 Tax=Solidesulfovibrio magneticus (strain ATCC 700980 / DSM 13731 / RS-1) TaxID=573370 RepID=C4XH70_SOLM1|nr:GGDEF domain-containing protein [Solidesulfovibrio magneticus]BAH73838.1 GGDEF domain protein [Solidesulfovibrio magneticus RS-1]
MSFRALWDNQGITTKLRLSFAVLFAIFLMGVGAGFVGLAVVRGAEADIVANLELRNGVLEMESQLERARRLYRDFLLQVPLVGFAQAQERYGQPALAAAARVIALSENLRRAMAAMPDGSDMAKRKIDMRFFTSTAKRFSQTLLSENELVILVADPETGLDVQMNAAVRQLGVSLKGWDELAFAVREISVLIQQYQLSRQRPVMQTAVNKVEALRRLIAATPGLETARKTEALRLCDTFDKVAARLMDTAVSMSANANDFALQARAVDPIAEDLRRITAVEVERAKGRIGWATRLAGGIVLFSALLGLGCIFWVARLLHRAVTNRIVELTRYAGNVRDGHFGGAIDMAGSDEIGLLARALADMNGRIHDLVGGLEDKVRQRTLELDAKNRELDAKNQALAVLSLTDRLTGLCNRRRLDQVLSGEWRRAHRYGTPFSVIMIDLDNFKDVNDTFGHAVGDAVLLRVADILLAVVRETDVVGRFGGEEFLLVCPETTVEDARVLAEALRRELQDTDFPIVGRITASFGLADYEADPGPAALVARADKALYRAKQSGRNQVIVAPTTAAVSRTQ